MTTTDAPAAAGRRRPRAIAFSLLRGWHAALSGAFLVAYLSGDEDTYAMHQVAGYLVLAAILVRLVAGVVAPAGSPLRLPRPDPAPLRNRLSARGGAARPWPMRPLLALMAIVLLVGIGVAAGSGAVADAVPSVEAVHEALGELALWIVLAHVAVVAARPAVARRWRRSRPTAPAACDERGRR
jgi:cytochrome b